MIAVPVREAPDQVRLRGSLLSQTALPFLRQYPGLCCHQLRGNWCAALRGAPRSPVNWLSRPQCSMPLAVALLLGRYTSWSRPHSVTRTTSAAAQTTSADVASAVEVAEEE